MRRVGIQPKATFIVALTALALSWRPPLRSFGRSDQFRSSFPFGGGKFTRCRSPRIRSASPFDGAALLWSKTGPEPTGDRYDSLRHRA
jgi:hypothetical protein